MTFAQAVVLLLAVYVSYFSLKSLVMTFGCFVSAEDWLKKDEKQKEFAAVFAHTASRSNIAAYMWIGIFALIFNHVSIEILIIVGVVISLMFGVGWLNGFFAYDLIADVCERLSNAQQSDSENNNKTS